MKIYNLVKILFLCLLSNLSLNAQDIEEKISKIESLIQANKLDEALEICQEALENDSDNKDLLYSETVIYIYKGDLTKAEKSAKKILAVDENDLNGLFLITNIYEGKQDYEQTLKYAKLGASLDTKSANFNIIAGKIYTNQKDYKSALRFLNAGLEKEPSKTGLYYHKAIATLISNTPSEMLDKQKQLKFNSDKISSFKLYDILEQTKNKQSKYYYKTLFEKFKNNYTEMGLDEYFMFYLGSANSENFSPYAAQMSMYAYRDSLFKLYDEKRYEDVIKGGNQYLENIPHEGYLYFVNALAAYQMRDYVRYEEFIFKYRAFLISILATGNGDSESSAFIVTSVKDEYTLLNFLALRSKGQALVYKENFKFDILNSVPEDDLESEDVRKIYFNIDLSFKSMENLFKGADKKKLTKEDKKKKKKKKDKKKKK